MKHAFIYFLVCLLNVCAIIMSANAQNYVLNGHINIDTGRIKLVRCLSKEFYPIDSVEKETLIRNGRFTFAGLSPYPLPYEVIVSSNKTYESGRFFIEQGTQVIFCDKDSFRIVPKLINKSMDDLNHEYKKAWAGYNIEYAAYRIFQDSLQKVYGNNLPSLIAEEILQRKSLLRQSYNNTLMSYIKAHNDSYVALLEMARAMEFRYSPVFDSAFLLFSDKLKNTFTGKVLAQKINSAKSLDIGNIFPSLSLLDTALKPISVDFKKGNRYTLVDFWFSHCWPCLSQFPKYKVIYDKYRFKGLEIVGISVDKLAMVSDWKQVIGKKELSWPQYLDIDGKLAEGLAIYTFPRNFLLDENMMIIKKDIAPEQLESLLEQ